MISEVEIHLTNRFFAASKMLSLFDVGITYFTQFSAEPPRPVVNVPAAYTENCVGFITDFSLSQAAGLA